LILQKGRFALVAGAVVFAAFILGLGTFMIGAQPAQHPRVPKESAAGRHSDDGGFSVTLTEPTEPYLVGIRKIAIEPQLPPGDTLAGADFFVDGRLVFTDRRPPYSTTMDFGQEIRRHTIIVTALTAGGRHAKVSFVSRSADLEGGAAAPLALVPVVVRNADGRLIDGLSVGDFVLTENGTRQPIVHFDDDPVPQSIAVTLQTAAPDESRRILSHGALTFANSLLSFDALGLVGVGAVGPTEGTAIVHAATPKTEKKPDKDKTKEGPPAAEGPPPPATTFSFDRALFEQHLADIGGGEKPSGRPLATGIQEATRGLQSRPRGRVLLLLLSGPGPRETVAAIGPAPEAPAPPPASAAPKDAAPADDEDLITALEALRRSGAALHVVVYGGVESPPFPQIKKTAEETGGEFLVAASAEAVDTACRRVAESLLHQYLVGFVPPSPEQQGWRTIELRLRRSDLVVQARRSYFASPPPSKRP